MTANPIIVGMRVKLRRGRDVGTVRELVEPKGRKRALVAWESDGCDQYVDIDKLTEASPEDTAGPPPTATAPEGDL